MKNRNPIAVALLPFVTLGIYSLYWLYETSAELRSKDYKVPPFWMIIIPSGGFILATILLSAGGGLKSNSLQGIGLFFLLITLLATLPINFYWYYQYGKAVEGATNGTINTVLALILLVLLGYIGQAIIQDAFNNATTEPSQAGTATPPSVASTGQAAK